MIQILEELKKNLRSLRFGRDLEVHERVDLRAWTALHVGGTAGLVMRCHTVEAVCLSLDLLASHGCKWYTWGTGSRVVPSDAGLHLPVINLGGSLTRWSIGPDHLTAGAGAKMTQLERVLAQLGLSFDEQGLASSFGAILHCHAGGNERRVPEELEWIEIARPGVEPERIQAKAWPGTDLDRKVIVRARFQIGTRRDTRPAFRFETLRGRNWRRYEGSQHRVFWNSGRTSAESLLANALPEGLKVGGAEVAPGAPNTIVTSRRSKSADVFELCRLMRNYVHDHSGVVLEPRLIFLDENGRIEVL